MSKIAVFTMDVESFTDIECLKNIKFKEDYNVNDGIKNYLDLLNKYNIKSNLFVLSSFIDSNKEILKDAFLNFKKILIYADYDADGITSAVVCTKALRNLGLEVVPYIPDRRTEGYGINKKSIENKQNQIVPNQ